MAVYFITLGANGAPFTYISTSDSITSTEPPRPRSPSWFSERLQVTFTDRHFPSDYRRVSSSLRCTVNNLSRFKGESHSGWQAKRRFGAKTFSVRFGNTSPRKGRAALSSSDTSLWVSSSLHHQVTSQTRARSQTAIKKEWNNAICSNVGGSSNAHVKWRKLDQERRMISLICGI